MLVGILIAVQLVHVDSLVGTTAFWRTRPIPRGALLTSKLLFAAIALILLPGVGDLVAATLAGLRWQDAIIAGALAAAAQAVYVVPALAVAAVTGTLAAFAIVGTVAVCAVFGLQALVGDWLPAPIPGPTQRDEVTRIVSKWVVLWFGSIIASAVVLPQQALWLKTRRTVVSAVVIQTAFAVVLGGWSWDFVRGKPVPIDRATLDPSAVGMHFNRDVVKIGLWGERRTTDRDNVVQAAFKWSGVPDGIDIIPVNVRALFVDRDGSVIAYHDRSMSLPGRLPRSENAPNRRLRALTGALGGGRWLNELDVAGDEFLLNVLVLKESRVRGQQGRLTIDVDLETARYAVVGRAPLVPNGRFTSRGQSVAVDDARLAGGDGAPYL
jgi:hypothetical protein